MLVMSFSDTVYWTELRFDEGGRYIVCSHTVGEERFKTWTPKDFNARDRVHEYGGNASFVHNGAVYFTNFVDQVMYRQSAPGELPVAVTETGKDWRYADGQYSAKVDNSWFIEYEPCQIACPGLGKIDPVW